MFAVALFLLAGTSQAQSADSKDSGSWQACRSAAIESEEGRYMEYIGGKTTVEEFLLDKCDYRPVVSRMDGRLALSDQDCAMLFHWSSEGICVPKETWALDMLTRQMDPRVF